MNLKPLNKDIMVKSTDINEDTSSPIFLLDDRQNEANWFEVIATSNRVTEVSVGDKVLLKYGDHMLPVTMDGVLVTTTSIDDVLAVMEKE